MQANVFPGFGSGNDITTFLCNSFFAFLAIKLDTANSASIMFKVQLYLLFNINYLLIYWKFTWFYFLLESTTLQDIHDACQIIQRFSVIVNDIITYENFNLLHLIKSCYVCFCSYFILPKNAYSLHAASHIASCSWTSTSFTWWFPWQYTY